MSRRLPLFVLSALAASAAFGGPGDGKFVGLPSTGELDAQRVLAARYGTTGTTGTTGTAGAAQPLAGALAAGVPHGFSGVTGVAIDSTSGDAQENVPITFGQVFAPGDVKPTDHLVGKLADGTSVPLQVDVKAHHPDGSVRHAVISAVLPALDKHQSLMLSLVKGGAAAASSAAAATAGPQALLDQGFHACVEATVDGQPWSACADRLLAGRQVQAWLSGPVTREWLVSAPLRNDKGAEHPHLAARFAVRWYPQAHKARVDVIVENDWAYEPNPRNFRYDARVTVGGKEVYALHDLNHLHHARWRKLFWWGDAPALDIRHDSDYLIATRALPHYDPSIVVSDTALSQLAARWTGKAIEPMGVGLATAYMPTTGGRGDIGLLPSWAAMYLLSMDPRAARVTLGTAELAGSWQIHYRDQRTGRPVSLLDHPYMTQVGMKSDTINPATHTSDAFPSCAAAHACDSPYGPDVAHQPNLVYLPYLLTGDHYLLEELQFWATYDALYSNPGYRDNVKGLMKSDQVRGQAWGLRTLGEAAYATPDDDDLKAYFVSVVKHNLDWYNATYTDNPAANKLGVIMNDALVYTNETGLAPWQDDFFTSSVGHLADLGFTDARRLLAWKARFSIGRMVAPGVCWIYGATYELTVRRSREAPYLTSMAEAYAATPATDTHGLACAGSDMAAALKLRPGEMTGTSSSTTGFPSNMQPALAYAADAGGEQGKAAWKLFMSRSVKPDYNTEPQFAIVPRTVKQ